MADIRNPLKFDVECIKGSGSPRQFRKGKVYVMYQVGWQTDYRECLTTIDDNGNEVNIPVDHPMLIERFEHYFRIKGIHKEKHEDSKRG